MRGGIRPGMRSGLRSGNPILRQGAFSQDRTFPGSAGSQSSAGIMTVQGTVNRALFLLLLVVAGGFTIWNRAAVDPTNVVVTAGMWGGLLGGLVMGLITAFKPTAAPITAPIYALLQGVFLGAISSLYNQVYEGIVVQAVVLTFATCLGMLGLYRAGVLRATPAFRRGVFAATAAIGLVYLTSIVLRLFGIPMPFLHDAGPIGIGISLVIVTVAALNLVLDFDLIEQGAAQGAPKHMEWYGAFALMVTLIWLYLEILRLLSKLQRR